jgi:integrase
VLTTGSASSSVRASHFRPRPLTSGKMPRDGLGSEATQTTFGELLERYAREVSPTKRGMQAEVNRIGQFRRSSLAKLSVSIINSKLISKWRDERLTEVSTGTVARDMALMNHVFVVAIRDWSFGLSVNPVNLVRKPPAGKPRDRTLTDEQRVALIAQCGKCKSPWIKPTVIFALETAARKGEILSLTWEDVDLQRAIAKVDGKTGARTIPLSQACIAMLRGLPRNIDGHYSL